jgi:hypothetical protein
MMGTKERNFRSLPDDISLEELVPKDNFYHRLEGHRPGAALRARLGDPLFLGPVNDRGIEGSRSHHRHPRPSRVPDFHRAGFEASTLCLVYLRLACHRKRVTGASLK